MRKLLTLAIFLLALGANNAFAQVPAGEDVAKKLEQLAARELPSEPYGKAIEAMILADEQKLKKEVRDLTTLSRKYNEAVKQHDFHRFGRLFDDAVWWLDHHDHNFQSYTRNDDNPTAVARLMRIVRRAVKLDRPTARLLTERLLEYISHTPPHRTADEWSYLFSINHTTYHCGYAPTPILVKGREVSDVLRETLGEERFDTLRKHYWKTFSRNTCALDIVTRWWQADGKTSLNRYVIINPRISKITTFLHELGKL
jgi:hypothetical protein